MTADAPSRVLPHVPVPGAVVKSSTTVPAGAVDVVVLVVVEVVVGTGAEKAGREYRQPQVVDLGNLDLVQGHPYGSRRDSFQGIRD